MGANGDQALRMATLPVHVFVVQHHSAIKAAVITMLRALARQERKHFMVIDGVRTIQILKANGEFPPPPAD
jgi:hypothetical protein